MIYLDNAATTRVDDRVFAEMIPWYTYKFGNPGAKYQFGREAAEAVEYARSNVARLFNCDKSKVIFTSGGTEGNNLVVKGVAGFMKRRGKNKILFSAIEHDSVIHAIESVCAEYGFSCDRIPVTKEGKLDMEAFRGLLTDDVGLVSVMLVNNEIGSVLHSEPGYEVGTLCRERGILFHSDCVQAAYEFCMDTKDKDAPDFITISSHKIHGPKGVGALYVRDKRMLSALLSGGKEQEFGLRGGTENVPGIVGFGKACAIIFDEPFQRDPEEYAGIFIDELSAKIGADGFSRNAVSTPCKTINLRICGVDAQTLVIMAGECGVCISAGSACRSNETNPSHVLKAVGLSDEEARESIRVSFSKMNNEYEVREGARILAECINALKGATL